MQKILFIIHSAAYGNESFFSALRLALQLQDQHKSAVDLKLFLMSDAVTGGLAKQNPAEGYHVQQMLEILTAQGATIKLCKTCTNARGITDAALAEGVEIGTLAELADWTMAADKVLNF
ncbi:DsrE/DsrF/TusD sulfur relay family protein [[Pasteurella] aerogenes]|nr:DsrE/DsrF/TusD sulfur relay family protein [[Pasteurella] aerogenes]MDY2795567.1 DsrE/DsrF/TusD sulfur relay family protein [[Pasteurella] aerogenes]MDY4478892.1 DsrE/DsrF/TusD sulfur relay family protein [[Pasteurella] aerogenes]MDY4594729.1 DsrE/DsrF/TusD sulfur relay family protein [[Pasteurella] aerogenes]VEG70244.1 protein ychN [[Pasteurella] aerogenes]